VLEFIPCIVRDDQEDEYTRLKTQLVANTGKALSPIEEAHAFARMLEANNVGVAALARDIGRPPRASTIA
jgi:ParB-like chromosome segregation protein Spo0J